MKVIEHPHTVGATEIIGLLRSDMVKGLENKEAGKRLSHFGPNSLDIRQTRSLLSIFISQFFNLLVWVLAAAAALAFLFHEWLDGIAILVVIIINALIGFFMEMQAVRSMDALRKLTRSYARVVRNSQLFHLPTSKLVPGDIVYLEAGEMVPADSRLLEINNLGISESTLTGESVHVSKQLEPLDTNVDLADRTNMVYKGTMVSRGNGKAIVVATGTSTQIGHIATITQQADKESTPLEKKLSLLSKKLIGLTLVLAAAIMIIGLLQGRDVYLMIETSIALAIAAIPEGLPIVATIALARGMLRLARHQVIVKKLSAVETLGETEVIFTDKTGTLTENQLLPDVLAYDFDSAEISIHDNEMLFQKESQKSVADTFAFEQMVKVCGLCNNASISELSDKEGIGDPLEVALLRFVSAAGTPVDDLQIAFPRIREIPFDSDTKMMGTLHKNGKRPDYLVCIKGALEVVLKESDYVLTRDGKRLLTDRQQWLDKADAMAAGGLRVLAVAYAEIDKPKEDFFSHLIFIGFIGFIDPPRKEIPEAIRTCHKAGIKVVMVTGDHQETARNIACRIGIEENQNCSVIHGGSLEKIEDFTKIKMHEFQATNVFARVTPAQKLQLIKLYQGFGKTVGMIGDGVNDTPALKKSDIGIAMGQRGTEAAKEVADLVLKDDAFTSIIVAIKQGRGIFENIRHFVVYLLSCNLSELLLVALAFFFHLPMPLLPLQILFINMVTDVFPAFALGMNKEAESVMEQPPRKKNTPIITRALWIAIIVYAVGITFASLGALLFATFYLKTNDVIANNFAFYTLILAQLWHVFNLPEYFKSFFNNEITRNKYVWMAIVISIGVMLGTYWNPVLREVLSLGDFDLKNLGYVIMFSLFPVVIVRIIKAMKWIR